MQDFCSYYELFPSIDFKHFRGGWEIFILARLPFYSVFFFILRNLLSEPEVCRYSVFYKHLYLQNRSWAHSYKVTWNSVVWSFLHISWNSSGVKHPLIIRSYCQSMVVLSMCNVSMAALSMCTLSMALLSMCSLSMEVLYMCILYCTSSSSA